MSENEQLELPTPGLIFWPVGTGDSTTVSVNQDVVLQVDLNHLAEATDDDDPHVPVVDRLVELLPTVDGSPYLSAFLLTHPDQDHCRGFAQLLEDAEIGELWFSPRVFREYTADLCEDAVAFRTEAKRRVKETIRLGSETPAGDRVRIIGYDELLKESDYEGFPPDRLTVPGNELSTIDDVDCSECFRAFIHAPFKDDASGERNETSVALQVSLGDSHAGRLLLLGDLSYPTIRKIFDVTDDAENLAWDVLLAPHHCSKSAMYWKGPDDASEKLKQDILDDLEKAAGDVGYVVASSEPIPASNKPGDNPPHAKAKSRYEEIAPNGFFCTQEHPTKESPAPMIFEVSDSGLALAEAEEQQAEAATAAVSAAVSKARGASEPPKQRVGFGAAYD